MSSTIFYSSLMLISSAVVENRIFKGTIYILIMSLPFIFLTVMRAPNFMLENIKTDVNKFKTATRLINHIYSILSLIDYEKRNSSYKYLF